MAKLPIHFSGDENHVHPRHTGHGRLDLVLALSAIFISAVSLYVAVEHGRIEQKLVAANSWPFLGISYDSGVDEITYAISNSGVGPAKLERLETLYRGEAVPDLDSLLERCCGLPADPAARAAAGLQHIPRSTVTNSVFRPGQQYQVLSVARDASNAAILDRLRHSMREISFRGCYCSVFDECWSSDFMDLTPRKVRACATGPSFNDILSDRPQPASAR